MSPEAPVRLLVLFACIILQGLWVFGQKEFSKFDRTILTWAMAYMSYYTLKSVFNF